MSSKYSQKLFNHPEQSATDALKAVSKKAIQKTAEAPGDFIGNKIADKITKSQERCHRILWRQLKMRMTKKYLEKKMYLQQKGRNC